VPRSYPAPTDPVSALTRPDGGVGPVGGDATEPHSYDHGRVIGLAENVRAWGAKGDTNPDSGIGTDDTAAFEAVIAARPTDNQFWKTSGATPYTIYVPPGQYKITSTITVPRATRLVGSGVGTVISQALNTDPLFSMGTESSIENMVIGRCSGFETAGPALFLDHVQMVLIRDMKFRALQNFGAYAIEGDWCLETYIQNCNFGGIEGGCVHLGDTGNGSVIRDCTMSNGGTGDLGGIFVEANGVLVEGNVIEGFRGDFGIKVRANHTTLLRNWIEDCDGIAFDLKGSDNISVIGNNLTGNAATVTGVDIENQRNVFLAQNEINAGETDTMKLVSGAAAADATTVMSFGNHYGGATTGVVNTSGLVNTRDVFVRVAENRDDFPTLPNVAMEVFKGELVLEPNTDLWWRTGSGNTIDTGLGRSAAKTISTYTDNAFRTGSAAHASLPAATAFAAGSQFYCTGDKQPLWSDGTNWVEADGTNH
jgi:hypothetical protein